MPGSLKMPVEMASYSVCFRAEVFKVGSKINTPGEFGVPVEALQVLENPAATREKPRGSPVIAR